MSAGVSVSPVITEDLRGVLATSTAAKLYKEPDWNDVSLYGEVGVARLFDEGTVSAGLRLGRRWLGGDRYSRETGPWLRGRVRVSPTSRLEVNLSAVETGPLQTARAKTDGASAQDPFGAIRSVLGLRSRPTLNWNSSMRTRINTAVVWLDWGSLFRRPSGAGSLLRRACRPLFDGTPGPDPLFLMTRRDRQVRFALNLLHRGFQYEGYAPFVGYAFESNDSNIPVNRYRNHGAVFGFSKTF